MLNRRTALKTLGAISASSAIPSLALAQEKEAPLTAPLRFGLIADLHGGLAQDAESRLDSFLSVMSEEPCDGLIQLGDFAFPNDKHQVYADKFNAAHDQTIHVIGNHEFEYGWQAFADAKNRAPFPVLGANLFYRGTDHPYAQPRKIL